MSHQKSLLLCLAVILVLSTAVAAEPQKEEQLVYGIRAWSGVEYAGTFIPRAVDSMYLPAGRTNIVNALNTLVYFWPITGEYMADWTSKRDEVEGTLEILSGNEVVATLEKEKYTFVYPEGPYSSEAELVTGPEAETEFSAYEKEVARFWEEASAYQRAQEEYQKQMGEILQEVTKTGRTYKPDELPKPPVEPQPPTVYVEQPQEAFIVKLPAGKYRVRLRKDGEIIPGSEKTLVSFAARRRGTGYILRPENKWTKPMESYDPTQFIYLSGVQPFYLQAFDVSEFPGFDYLRTVKATSPSAGRGMEDSFAWVVTSREKENVRLQVLQNGEVVAEVARRPYYVKQTAGHALGYEILEWDPTQEEMNGRQPSFYAFRIDLPPGNYQLRAVGPSGEVLPGSSRGIRNVSGVTGLWIFALVPLLIGAAVRVWRHYRFGAPRAVRRVP